MGFNPHPRMGVKRAAQVVEIHALGVSIHTPVWG